MNNLACSNLRLLLICKKKKLCKLKTELQNYSI